MTRRSISASERIYALLLHAYPRHYRRRFGRDQRELFRDLHRQARGGGRRALTGLWIRQLLDLVRSVPVERLAQRRNHATPLLIPAGPASTPRSQTPGDSMFAMLLQDLAYSTRVLRKSPLFTAIAVLVIALGAGAVTTIYSAANAVLLRPIPGVRDPGSLVDIVRTQGDGQGSLSASYPYANELRAHVRALSGVVAWSNAQLTIGVGAAHVASAGNLVTANYFDVLGVTPELGRFFVPAEDSGAGAHPVTVISHGFWKRALGGDPNVVGRVLRVNGTPLTVIGVAPPTFDGTVPVMRMDAWIPMMMQPQIRPGEDLLDASGAGWLQTFGRLKPGVSRAAAQAEVAALTQHAAASEPAKAFRRFTGARLYPLAVVPPEVHTAVLAFFALLFAIAMLVLLIASVDVAGMMLARGIGRRREMAVRAALGAGRRRLLAQLLTEILMLYGLGALGGIGLAYAGTRLLERVPVPTDVPLVLDLTPDVRVLAFALAVALITGLAFGLAPALRSTKADLVTGLRGDTAGSGSRRSRARSVLVIGQMALSLLLLVAAGLLMRALQRGQRVDPGMDVHGVAVASLDVRIAGYDSVSGARVYERLKQGMLTVPGVTSVSYASLLPLSGSSMSNDMRVDGYTPSHDPNDNGEVDVGTNIVDADYFTTVRMPLVDGRGFAASDNAAAPRVAIVNQAFARTYWAGSVPIGRTFHMDSALYTVVGVVHDAKYRTLNEASTPFVFLPMSQHWDSDRELLVRTAGDPVALASAVRRQAQLAGPNLPPPQASTLAAATSIVLLPQRVAAAVTGALGVVGLLLAVVGLYGVIAYSMTQRTREIGIRMALGADRRAVLGLVLGEGMRLVGVGIAAGLTLALVVTRFMRPFLFGVSPVDPLTFAAITLGLAATAAVASYLPARRAARADPAIVLRQE